jgi:hypothetical protein
MAILTNAFVNVAIILINKLLILLKNSILAVSQRKNEAKKSKSIRLFRKKVYLCCIVINNTYEKEQIFHHIDSFCRCSGPDDWLLEA